MREGVLGVGCHQSVQDEYGVLLGVQRCAEGYGTVLGNAMRGKESCWGVQRWAEVQTCTGKYRAVLTQRLHDPICIKLFQKLTCRQEWLQ